MTATDSRAQRAVWTFAGQGLSSSSNFLVALWALANVPAGDFAALSLCLTTFLFLAQLGRALVSTPILLLYSDEPGTRPPPAAAGAVSAGVGFGLAAAAVVALAGAVLGALGVVDAPLFLGLAAALPFLLYQDTLRHLCIARHRPALAAASDASWLVLQLAGYLLLAQGTPSAASGMAVWASSGAIAGVWVGIALQARPGLRGATGWLRRHRQLCQRLVIEFAVNSGSYYAVAYGIAILAGVAQLGYLRAAQSLFGPASVLLLGGTVLGVPEGVRARHDMAALKRFSVRLSGVLALVSLAAGAMLYSLLPSIGPRFFAGMDGPVRALLPALALFGAGIGASAGALAGLRAIGEGAWIVRAQVARGALALLVGLPGAALVGARGGLAGLAVAEAAFAVAVWIRFAGRGEHAPVLTAPAPSVTEEELVAVSAQGACA